MPQEDLIYFGDTAHVPYGSKSKEAVTRYSVCVAKFLAERRRDSVWNPVSPAAIAFRSPFTAWGYSRMSDLDALLAGIVANPNDALHWLVTADWLEDHGVTLVGRGRAGRRQVRPDGEPPLA